MFMTVIVPLVGLEELAKVVFLNNVRYLKNNLIDSSGPTGSCSE